jgi:chromosome segregation ATPase
MIAFVLYQSKERTMTGSVDHVSIELGNIVSDKGGLEPAPIVAEPNCWGWCCGRIVKDWTQVVGGVLVLGGLGAGGAGIALKETFVIVGGASAILASSILLCVRISCLKPEKELENRVKDLKNEVSRLERNEAALKRTRKNLETVLGEAQEGIHELGRVLKVPIEDLAGITAQMSAIEEKLRVLIDLYHRYKETTEALSSDIQFFKKSNKVAKSHLVTMEEKFNRLDKVEDDLSDEIDEYQDAAEFHNKQNERLKETLETFKGDFVEMQKRFLVMKEALAELRKQVIKIDEADDKFLQGGKEFKEGGQKFKKEVIPQLQQVLTKLEQEVSSLVKDCECSKSTADSSEEGEAAITIHKGESESADSSGNK